MSVSVSWNAGLTSRHHACLSKHAAAEGVAKPDQQGRSDGVYIGIYTPQNQSTLQILLAVLFTCGTLTCFDFEIGMTS